MGYWKGSVVWERECCLRESASFGRESVVWEREWSDLMKIGRRFCCYGGKLIRIDIGGQMMFELYENHCGVVNG
jgi:hypothetical protein